MKKLSLLFLCSLIVLSCKTETKTTDLEVLNLKGKVKKISTNRFDGIEKFGEAIKEKAISMKSEYESPFLEKIKANSFLDFYLNLERFQEHSIGGKYENLNVFFDYNASFNKNGFVTTLNLPHKYYSKKDSLVYKRNENLISVYNKNGKEVRKKFYEDNKLVKIENNEIKDSKGNKTNYKGTVTREYDKGILSKTTSEYDGYNNYETLFTNKNNKLSYRLNGEYNQFSIIEYDYNENSLKLIPNRESGFWGNEDFFIKVMYNSFNKVNKIKIFLSEKEKGTKEVNLFEFSYNDNQDVNQISLNVYEKGNIHKDYKKKVFEYVYDNNNNWTKKTEKHYKNKKLKSVEISEREIEYWK